MTHCLFTLCRVFDRLSFDPISFDPKSFEPGLFDPKLFDPGLFDSKSFDPLSLDPRSFDPMSLDPNTLYFWCLDNFYEFKKKKIQFIRRVKPTKNYRLFFVTSN